MAGPTMDEICDVAIERFVEASRRAAPGSRLDLARCRLDGRFQKVATAALRARLLAATSGPGGDETVRRVTEGGYLGAVTVVMGIVADTIGDVVGSD
jgi:hypothetical protein